MPKDKEVDGLQGLVGELTDRCQNIGIEFECGDCCKKVVNGSKLKIIDGVVVLKPAHDDCLILKAFSGGELVDKEILKAIVIPLVRICSIEIDPVDSKERDRGHWPPPCDDKHDKRK